MPYSSKSTQPPSTLSNSLGRASRCLRPAPLGSFNIAIYDQDRRELHGDEGEL